MLDNLCKDVLYTDINFFVDIVDEILCFCNFYN